MLKFPVQISQIGLESQRWDGTTYSKTNSNDCCAFLSEICCLSRTSSGRNAVIDVLTMFVTYCESEWL